MTEFKWSNPDLAKRIQALVDNPKFTEFNDLREYPPVVRVGTVDYPSDEAFEEAVKKKLGENPVTIKKAPDWVRSITGDKGPGVEFVILADEAILAGYSPKAQDGAFHRVLAFLELQGKVDKDTGSWSPKTDNGRPVWKIERPAAQSSSTIKRFGPIDLDSANVVKASIESGKGQGVLDEGWMPKVPADIKRPVAAAFVEKEDVDMTSMAQEPSPV